MDMFMRCARCGIIVAILQLAGPQAFAQAISTTAGGGGGADGGPAATASLNAPHGVALDAAGNVYIADTANHRVRRVDGASGIITTIAGNGMAGFNGDGIAASSAQINLPVGIAVNAAGDVFFSEFGGQRIRKVAQASGLISTVAGTGSAGNFNGDAIQATSANLGAPRGIALDSAGNLYFASRDHHRIRKIDAGTGLISTVAGTGTSSVTGGYNGDSIAATSAQLFYPDGVAVAANGEVFIADTGNARIRRVSVGGTITTIAGNGSNGYSGEGPNAADVMLNVPSSVTLDALGNLFIGDTFNSRIRRVVLPGGAISTVTGSGMAGFTGDGGPALAAQINFARGIAFSSFGTMFIADTANARIRQITRTVPGAPAITAVTPGNGSLLVQFSPPASDGLAPVTGFSAVCGSASASGSASPLLVNGLTNGSPVACTVAASNAVGAGPASPPSTPVVPMAATSATALTVTGLGSSNLGAPITLQASVTGTGPTGSVAFYDGASPIAGCASRLLSSGSASCTTAGLPLGERTLTARYLGDGIHSPSISNAVMHTVNPLSQTNPTILWNTLISAGMFAIDHRPGCVTQGPAPKSMAVDGQGNIFVTGCVGSLLAQQPVSDRDLITLKVNGNTGEVMWMIVEQGTQVRNMGGYAIAVDGEGNAVVTGYLSTTAGKAEIYTKKFNGQTGSEMWFAIFSGTANDNDVGYAVAIDNTGNVLVTGYSTDTFSLQAAYRVIKYQGTTGTQLWTARLLGLQDAGRDIVTDASGNVFVAGYGNDDNITGLNMRTVKFDGTTGALLWKSSYAGNATNGTVDKAVAIALDGSGNPVVTGISFDTPGNHRIRTLKYNGATGAVLWNTALTGSVGMQNDMAAALALDGAGNAYVTGSTYDFTGARNMRTAKLDAATGAVVWSRAFSTGTDTEEGFAIAVDGASNVTVTGFAPNGSGTPKVQVVRYDGVSGFQQWSLQDARNGSNYGQAIAAAGTGAVYVFGYAESAQFNLLKIASPPPQGYSLVVNKSGNGTVNSSPAGIQCGADCLEGYASGSTVTLAAAPDAGASFLGWSGCDSTAGSQCVVAMNAARNVSAGFSANVNLLAVKSRKVHGMAGAFDLPLTTGIPIGGPVSVEPRASSGSHSIVFQFDGPVLAPGTVTVRDAAMNPMGSASSSIGANPNELIVALGGIPNASRATVQVSGVNGTHASMVSIGFLVADVNGSRLVGSDDLLQTRARSGQIVVAGNFLFDINLSGHISAGDVSAIKARNAQSLP